MALASLWEGDHSCALGIVFVNVWLVGGKSLARITCVRHGGTRVYPHLEVGGQELRERGLTEDRQHT